MIELRHSFERGEFHGRDVTPWPSVMDHLGLEQAVDGLGGSGAI
jgi:hypothetical protein